MGERLARTWRVVRRREAIAVHDDERCSASGWHLSSGCTDGDGATICPLCSQRVRTVRTAEVPRGVEIIQAHCA